MNKKYPKYQLIPVLIQWKQDFLQDEFPPNEYIYNGILTKYKNKIGTEDIVVISQQGKLLTQNDLFSKLAQFEEPILNIFRISDILAKLNEANNDPQMDIAKRTSLIEQEIEKSFKEKIFQLSQEIQTYQETISRLENQILNANQVSEIISDAVIAPKKQMIESSLEQCNVVKSKEYIEILINQKNNDIKILEQRNSKILDSSISEQEFCQFCNNQIDSDVIQLSCQHTFHDECIDTLLQAQISSDCTTFTCLCNNKIKPKELLQLSNVQAAQIYQLQINFNQLKSLKASLSDKIRKCDKKFCSFFYIYDEKSKIKGKYCPSCLL